MYRYLKGVFTQNTPTSVVVEIAGIGYRVVVPPSVLAALPKLGDTLCLHTSFVVRELSHTLYGFMREAERDQFEQLIGISGVGPKLGLSIVGHLCGDNLYQAVHRGDVARVSEIPGVGKKTAQRLIMELRDRLEVQGSSDLSTSSPVERTQLGDAVSALMNLGYPQKTAKKACEKVLAKKDKVPNLAELIKEALAEI